MTQVGELALMRFWPKLDLEGLRIPRIPVFRTTKTGLGGVTQIERAISHIRVGTHRYPFFFIRKRGIPGILRYSKSYLGQVTW